MGLITRNIAVLQLLEIECVVTGLLTFVNLIGIIDKVNNL
jgi:hypothetical protein